MCPEDIGGFGKVPGLAVTWRPNERIQLTSLPGAKYVPVSAHRRTFGRVGLGSPVQLTFLSNTPAQLKVYCAPKSGHIAN